MAVYGTLTLFDNAGSSMSVAQYGENRAYDVLRADLDAHNDLVANMLREMADLTGDATRTYGTAGAGEMVPADELGTADVQRYAPAVATVGAPLYLYQYSLQWTRTWMQTHSVADLERQYVAARQADLKRVIAELKKRIFTSTNNTTYVDRRVDNVTFAIRAFLNGDSQPIPTGPNGETFVAATHTHFLTSAAHDAAGANALIDHIVEHGHGGGLRVYSNRASETAWRALPDFIAYLDPRITPASTAPRAAGTLDVVNVNNRAIGIYRGAEIWVKPYIPANYHFAFDASSPAKPLMFRTRAGTTLGNLAIAAEMETHPLRAQVMEREFGVGTWTRSNGAVWQSNNAGAYAIPAGL